MRTAVRLGLALCLAVPACLETEEEIEVAPDGSLTVQVRVEGDGWDLADGYPLPAGPGWTAADSATAVWRAAMAEGRPGAWTPPLGAEGEDERVALQVEGRFASAADLPERYAPAADPYAAAFQRRGTRVDIQQVGAHTLYTFERTFHARDTLYRLADEWTERRLDALPDDIKDQDDDESLTPEQWALVVEALRDAFAQSARMVVREALAPAFGVAGAGLPARAAQQVAEDSAQAAASVLRAEEFIEHARRKARDEDGADDFDVLDAADRRAREAVRALLTARLDAGPVAWEVRNAILQRFEHLLVGWDQADDLRDETFDLRVRMPGVVVGGNFTEREGSRVGWTIRGEDLLKGDARLTVSSVVDASGR
jgi:hypothetical protein